MPKKLLVATLLATALTGAAASRLVFAGQVEADPCAARRSRGGQIMFRAVAGHVTSGHDTPVLMRTHVRPLVMSGRSRREEAAHNAQPAWLRPMRLT